MTLVNVPNPLKISIGGCEEGMWPLFSGAFFSYRSSLTVSFFLPFARRLLITFRPFFVAIRSRNPCVFFLFRLWG
jgi:hypothetical protein